MANRNQQIVKIAPGHKAMFWPECRKGGYICVGWDETGPLTEYRTVGELRESYFAKHYSAAKATAKANELWTLRGLRTGDVVVANNGITEILAIGEVQPPGYKWDKARKEFKHTVRVDWDTSYQQRLNSTKYRWWSMVTVARLEKEELRAFRSKQQDFGKFATSAPEEDEAISEPERTHRSLLDRRGQARFRKRLLAAYAGQRAVTRCIADAVLEAAHINPWCIQANNRLENGLLLRSDIHTLFDRRLISVDPTTMAICVSPQLSGTEYEGYAGNRLRVPRSQTERPSNRRLAEHFERFNENSR